MAYSYIVDNTATQVLTDRSSHVVLTINADFTGTVKVIDGTSGTTANVATITNPRVGQKFEYFDFKNGVLIIASGNCDITASADTNYASS